jgi:hypothetical protein
MNGRPVLKLRNRTAPVPMPEPATKPAPESVAAVPESTPTVRAAIREAPAPGADVPWGEYWYVWAPSALRPSRRVATEFAAVVSVKRLRALMPDKQFLVYRAVCVDE